MDEPLTSRWTSRRRVRARPSCCASPGCWPGPTPRSTWSWSPASNTSPPPGPTAPTPSRSNLEENFDGWLRHRLADAPAREEEQPADTARPAEESAEEHRRREESRPNERGDRRSNPARTPHRRTLREEQPGQAPPEEPARRRRARRRADRGTVSAGNGRRRPARPGWLARALSPYAVPARLEHAGPVDADTLELLACNATIRAALLAPSGALLDLGRTQRLATPAQKTALLARDGGCVIPGCTVPGDACDAHHVQWWTRGGPTDLDNLALACGRHHTEIHQDTWEIQHPRRHPLGHRPPAGSTPPAPAPQRRPPPRPQPQDGP